MAGNKFLKKNANGDIEEEFSVQATAGQGDAGKVVALDADGMIDETMLRSSEVVSMVASETLAAGNIINIWDDAGTPKVRKATNTGVATKGMGFVKDNITSGATGKVYFEGKVTGLSGLTPGKEYFLGVAGAIVDNTELPTAASSIVQQLGKAYSATSITFEAQPIIILA